MSSGMGGMSSGMGTGGLQFTGSGFGSASGNGGRQPRSLRALVNGSMFGGGAGSSTDELDTANHRQGVLADGVPSNLQPPLQPGSLLAAPAAVSSEEPAAPFVQPAITGGAIDEMLDSLSERDEERKV
jgi:hypothetical protein